MKHAVPVTALRESSKAIYEPLFKTYSIYFAIHKEEYDYPKLAL